MTQTMLASNSMEIAMFTCKNNSLILFTCFFLVLSGCGGSSSSSSGSTQDPAGNAKARLNGVEVSSWMYQIQDLDDNAMIDELAATDYDMLVVEPGNNFNDFSYNTDYLVSTLKRKNNGDARILLAYIDIGEAEDYRSYWQQDWIAPTENTSGTPEFLVTIDPDGWTGNYPVAYWQQGWKDIWLGSGSIIAILSEAGFDGVYLDWVEAYDDVKVREFAAQEGVNPEDEMLQFIDEIGAAGRVFNSNFIVIVQNAPYLVDHDPTRYAAIVDAVAMEDTWFYGEGDAAWDDINAGDLSGGERHSDDYSTANRIRQSKAYLELGIPVFTVDYCIAQDNASQVYQSSSSEGFIPLVTRVSLSRLTETPPP
jgi:cysteinyl-tRNA synthetase